ncbi:MAG: UDP-N-acetylmuramyl-tripeptide synthetase [Parcubacteria group bacterium]|nr:UDP-N-acetylmuramyl-tripeptide synthetase [Parcubacteria group bacterium]
MIKQTVKRLLPTWALSSYHKLLAVAANLIYWFPSHRLVVVGVTGTKGKSSTVLMITRILEEAGFTVGSMNTIFFKVGKREWMNNKKQGMLGRFALQKMLREMVRKKCDHAVIEVTSEGIAQHRQWGIAFDVLVFTNLSHEHIVAHGSYEKYRAAKQLIFKELHTMRRKATPPVSPPYQGVVRGGTVKKAIVVNAEDPEAENFLKFKADEKWSVACDSRCPVVLKHHPEKRLAADAVAHAAPGMALSVEGHYIQLSLHGAFMAQNALLAIAACRSLGVTLSPAEAALEKIESIPGRVEVLNMKSGAAVVIDYAHEPKSFEAILKTGRELAGANRVISVFGATGGGRDTAKRPIMGALAAAYSDCIILTTDDPYDDDPQAIINDILPGITSKRGTWELGKNVFSIISRTQAISRALALAKSGDVVLLLGKGSERVMAVANGKHIPWSDRAAVAEHNA